MKHFLQLTISLILTLATLNSTFAEDSKKLKSFSVLTIENSMEFNILSEEDKTAEITSFKWRSDIDINGTKNITIPTEITYNDATYSISKVAITDHFYNSKFESITIPNGIKQIKENSYNGAIFSEINLPSTLTEIGKYAFNSPDIETIALPPMHGGTYDEYHSHDVTAPLIISNYIEEISECTFDYNIFSNVTLGKNVKKLEMHAFGGIDNLICCATTPPEFILDSYNKFTAVIPDIEKTNLLVPPGCKEIYEQNENWNKVASIGEYEYYVDAKFEEGKNGKMLINKALKLNPVITWLHEGSSERYRVWTSSDESVATVSQAGVIVSRNYGTATITLTIEDERGVPFDCTFNVEVTDEAGVSDILDNETDTTVEVFTLNGLKVGDTTDNLPAGLYIVKSAKEVKKICIK